MYEYKKQSINDILKYNFKDLEIDKDYNIDFILVHDKNDNPIFKTIGSGSE